MKTPEEYRDGYAKHLGYSSWSSLVMESTAMAMDVHLRVIMEHYHSEKMKEEWDKIFTAGYSCACANMMIDHDQPTMVEDCFSANFHTAKQLKEMGVDDYDIEILKPIIKEIIRKSNA